MYIPASDADKRRFREIVKQVTEENVPSDGGIGTLGEKPLHAVLKRFFQPDSTCREVPVGRYVADSKEGDHITEIQTRSLGSLCPKLTAFSKEEYTVTVVYPHPAVRRLAWIAPDGTVGSLRTVTRKGDIPSAFTELYRLRPVLTLPRLTLRVVLLAVDDYRIREEGTGPKKRGHSLRYARIPVDIIGQYVLETPDDYRALLPPHLPDTFTAKTLCDRMGIPKRQQSRGIAVLCTAGVIEKIGRQGRAFLYRIPEKTAKRVDGDEKT